MTNEQNNKKRLFLDESGECSFSAQSIYKHFVLTILSVDECEAKNIKKNLQRRFRHFINNGWPKDKEIKAVNLYSRLGNKAVNDIINSLLKLKSLEVSYIVVNKHGIKSEAFKQATYGIAYNYFTGILLSELIFQDGYHNTRLIYDLRNKETHEKRHFKEHLKTKILGMGLEKGVDIHLEIDGMQSDKCYGLMAVDFFSWAIFRKFEHGDDRFFKLFRDRLKRKREWYI